MTLKFERKLPLILFFVFLMLTTIGFVFYQRTVSVQEAIEWERHSQDVISRLDEIYRLSLDSEAAVRGFVMVGNETYLEGHVRAAKQIDANIAYLTGRFGTHKPQLDEIERLKTSISQYSFEASRRIDIRRRDGLEAASIEVSPHKVKPALDGIRSAVERLKTEETSLLRRRQKGLEVGLYRTIWILIISSVAGIAALGLANFMVAREIGRRRAAEADLVTANFGLEQKVAERTVELAELNKNLVEIGSEREAILNSETEARREAEVANRLRDEFMATVSHELRTPLNSILGWARMLNDGDLNEDQETKAVSTIIRSAETQNRLIEDLLDVARLISGKLELEMEPVDLAEAVEHSVESLRPASSAKGISIEIQKEVSPGEAKVIGDRGRLEQVFSNLAANAIKFSRRKGEVRISVERSENEVKVVVKDNGIGISPAFQPLVFERFRQDTPQAEKNGGLGLGLAIVRNLVEMHGGSVSVFSEGEGKGSAFTVRLPASE
jgi:signal transduction histidine kinase